MYHFQILSRALFKCLRGSGCDGGWGKKRPQTQCWGAGKGLSSEACRGYSLVCYITTTNALSGSTEKSRPASSSRSNKFVKIHRVHHWCKTRTICSRSFPRRRRNVNVDLLNNGEYVTGVLPPAQLFRYVMSDRWRWDHRGSGTRAPRHLGRHLATTCCYLRPPPTPTALINVHRSSYPHTHTISVGRSMLTCRVTLVLH